MKKILSIILIIGGSFAEIFTLSQGINRMDNYTMCIFIGYYPQRVSLGCVI